MKIHLESGDFGWDFLLVAEDGRDRLIKTDWDYPGIAETFGWNPCESGLTDGTVDCPCECGKEASDMIDEAFDFLTEIADSEIEVEDPGYFD